MSLTLDIQKQCGTMLLESSLTAQEGVHGLLGVSGAGKSMTLKCIAGIETPDKGRIVLGNRVLFDSEQGINLPPQQRKVGYLFQQYALFPTMTVEKNIQAGTQCKEKKMRQKEVAMLLSALQLEPLAKKYPHQLSGGEGQRVALARILASKPEALLLDEPLSALDSYLKWQVELELLAFLKDFPHPVLLVSHSQEEIAHLCQQVWVMSQGKTQPCITVETLFRNPKTVDACLLSGCKNLSPATVEEGKVVAHHWGVTLQVDNLPSTLSHVAIHGHQLQLAQAGDPNGLCCTLTRVLEGGHTLTLVLTPVGGTAPLHMEVSRHLWQEPPKELWIKMPKEHLFLF